MRSMSTLFGTVMLITTTAYADSPRTVVLAVQDMTCAVCPITVNRSLERVPGVEKVMIDFDSKTAVVRFDPDKTAPAALVKATTEAGYPSTIHKVNQP